MNTNWQVVLGNIHSTFRVIRHLVFSLGKSSAPPCVPRAVKVMLLLLSLQFINACDTSNRNSAPIFSQEPTLLQYDSLVPLSTAIAFESDQPVFATYKISDGQSSWQAHTLSDPNQKPTHLSKSHRDFLLKFKPDTKHRIYVRITNAMGQSVEYGKPLRFRTPALPADFPQIEVETATDNANSTREDAIALIGVLNNQPEQGKTSGSGNNQTQTQSQTQGWLIGLEGSSAEVVWYMPLDLPWQHFEQPQSGNLLLYNKFGSSAGSALEVDMLGNPKAAWVVEGDRAFERYLQQQNMPSKAIQSAKDLYYSWVALPNRHQLALSVQDPNLITEFDSQGNIEQQWHLADALDLQALDSQALNFQTRDPQATVSHGNHNTSPAFTNQLSYRPQTDSLILSLPKYRMLVAMGRERGDLQWMMGDLVSTEGLVDSKVTQSKRLKPLLAKSHSHPHSGEHGVQPDKDLDHHKHPESNQINQPADQPNDKTDSTALWLPRFDSLSRTHIDNRGNLLLFVDQRDSHLDNPQGAEYKEHKADKEHTDDTEYTSRVVSYAIDQAAMTFKPLIEYPLTAQQPVVVDFANSANGKSSLLFSYQLPYQASSPNQTGIPKNTISQLVRLSLNNRIPKAQAKSLKVLEASEQLKASKDQPLPPTPSISPQPIMSVQLNSVINHNQLIKRLVPPELSESDYTQLANASDKHASAQSGAQQTDQASQAPQAPQGKKVQIYDEIPIAEGDWQVAVDFPEGRFERTLVIDKQQGPIGLGYLDNYPVMVVINGNRLQLKVRTTGTKGTATWRYSGTIDDSGFEAQGELNVSDDQNQILAANVPWQAYRK